MPLSLVRDPQIRLPKAKRSPISTPAGMKRQRRIERR
jgi:hypothetical protein